MELYKGKYWEVIFGDWCQEFVGYCIVTSKKESLSELTSEEWIELGAPGLLFFLLAWFSLPYCTQKRARKSAIMLLTLYALNMLTDCMFGRFDGIALWCVWMVLIRLQADAQGHQQTAGNAQ